MSLPVWLWWHKLPINCRELNDSSRCKLDFNSQRMNNGTGSSAVGGPLKQIGQVRAECWSRMTSVGN